MPVDAGGNATRPTSPVPVSGQTADAPQVNVPINDIYAILNMLVFLDGRKSLRGNIPMNGHRARGAADAEQPQDYVTLAQLQSALSGAATVPTGVIMSHTGTSAPSGWVLANGASLSRSTFPNLWAFVQSSGNLAASEASKQAGQYGPGDGSTTFTVPNLYADGGYFIRPMTSGRGIGTVQADEIRSHNHGGSSGGGGSHNHASGLGIYGQQSNLIAVFGRTTRGSPGQATYGIRNAAVIDEGPISQQALTETVANHTHTIPAQGGSETRPKNIAYPVIIKA